MVLRLGRRLNRLLRYQEDFESVDIPEYRQKPKSIFKIWSSSVEEKEEVKRLKKLAASGQRLQALVDSEGWKDVKECKLFYQSNADARTKNPDTEDRDRFRAAVEYLTIEGLFADISRRIKNGKDAQAELDKLQKKQKQTTE